MFDFVSDIHGCIDEFREMLSKLGYVPQPHFMDGGATLAHPAGRKLVIIGDLNDRGPDSASVLELCMELYNAGTALVLLGNHDFKLLRYLKGNKVKLSHGLEDTVKQLEARSESFRNDVRDFLGKLPYELILNDDKVSVSHAGLTEALQGVRNGKAQSQALYGLTTGKMDEDGYPVRIDWAPDYKGHRLVIHGHTPQKQVRNLNRVINLDTGCPFGNYLTCLRYPEMEFVQVKAAKNYAGREIRD